MLRRLLLTVGLITFFRSIQTVAQLLICSGRAWKFCQVLVPWSEGMNGDEVNIFDTLKIEVHDGVQSGMNIFC